ncbi:oxygenase MpaB family protein [Mycobacterium sp. ML1]
MWVADCLFVGLEDTYQLLRGPITEEQRAQFYRFGRATGHHLASVRRSVTRDRKAFDAYRIEIANRCGTPMWRRIFPRDLIDLRIVGPVTSRRSGRRWRCSPHRWRSRK